MRLTAPSYLASGMRRAAVLSDQASGLRWKIRGKTVEMTVDELQDLDQVFDYLLSFLDAPNTGLKLLQRNIQTNTVLCGPMQGFLTDPRWFEGRSHQRSPNELGPVVQASDHVLEGRYPEEPFGHR